MNENSESTSVWLGILRSPPARLIMLGGIIFLMMAKSNRFMLDLAGSPVAALGSAAAMSSLALIVYAAYARYIERRHLAELDQSFAARELAFGGVLGAGLITACILILIVLGLYRVEGLNAWTYLLPAMSMAISSGVFEELIFRGVLFRSVEDWFGSWVALAVSSLVFGLVHLLNPAGTLLGALFISIEAGVLLAAAYMLTRRLWVGIGIHIFWNYTQSGIFSGIVSGGDAEPGLIKAAISGPVALTGGSFGIESSVFAFLLCTAAGVILLVMAVRRGHIVPPCWKR